MVDVCKKNAGADATTAANSQLNVGTMKDIIAVILKVDLTTAAVDTAIAALDALIADDQNPICDGLRLHDGSTTRAF